MKNHFICLLPEANLAFEKALKGFSKKFSEENIKYPSHLTLYFFGAVYKTQLHRLNEWLNTLEKLKTGKIQCVAKGVNSFLKNDLPFVFFLDVHGEKLTMLNHDLLTKFRDIRVDKFAFMPHISLFFPKGRLTENQVSELNELFSDVKEFVFDKIALAFEEEGKIEMERVIAL